MQSEFDKKTKNKTGKDEFGVYLLMKTHMGMDRTDEQ